MKEERSDMTDRILNLALEIIYLLTGEKWIIMKNDEEMIMKKSSEDHMSSVPQGWSRGQSPMRKAPIHSLTPERSNKKILEVTQKIIELLTGEVPIRCQDVTVYFSMEEWEYLEGHKDLYKDVMMEDHQTLTSPDGSSNGNPPERCPRPLYSQDSTQENQEDQGDCMNIGNVEDSYAMDEDQCKEVEIPPEISTDLRDIRAIEEEEGYVMTKEEAIPIENIVDGLLSADSFIPGESFPNHSLPITNHTDQRKRKSYSCSECGKCFTQKSTLISHGLIHLGIKPYSCSQCGKCFNTKFHLLRHHRIHTGEKPYSCSECGKCFGRNSVLVNHLRIHTEEKPYTCFECGKGCTTNSALVTHMRTHTGAKAYSCSECGKGCPTNSALVSHMRTHTGEKPHSCSECGKCFSNRSTLFNHRRTHTGEKPYSCLSCGKCFARRSCLTLHTRTHTR